MSATIIIRIILWILQNVILKTVKLPFRIVAGAGKGVFSEFFGKKGSK